MTALHETWKIQNPIGCQLSYDADYDRDMARDVRGP